MNSLEIHKKLRKNKVFISLLIAIVLVFSYEVNKPKAVVPLLAGILGGLIVEEMVHMGFKWGTKQAGKKKADDWAEAFAANPANKFDFETQNPYLNKDGSVYITPSAHDRAKLASLIAGTASGLIIEDALTSGATKVLPPNPDYPTTQYSIVRNGGDNPYDDCAYNYVANNSKFEKVNSHMVLRSTISGQSFATVTQSYPDQNIEFVTMHNKSTTNLNFYVGGTAYGYNSVSVTDQKAYAQYQKVCGGGHKLHTSADGLIFPSTIDNVYDVPMNTPSDYLLPNQEQLSNIPFVINNIMPASENEGYVTWDDILAHYNGSIGDFNNAIGNGIEHYLENGDINNTEYNTEIINNYYTDVDQDKKKEDVKEEIEDFVPVVPPPDGEIIPVEPIDRSLLQVMKESYSYLADSIDTAIEAMKNITDGATGIVNYLDQAFRWLPAEWRALFGAAFILGVFAHFFRR